MRWQGPPFPSDDVSFDSHARVKDMDIEGVDGNMILPSGGVPGFCLVDDVKLFPADPITGRRGDPTFDAFYASQVEPLVSAADTERSLQQAGVALLDRIGPAILVTHSQAAYFSWHVTDKRPRLVKGNTDAE